ncbi:MAG: hypothetical protein ACTSU4_01465 [Promethearchaeota archaeon]
MIDKENCWTCQLDWLNIVRLLGLETMDQIPEEKREKAIKRVAKEYSTEVLLSLDPSELDQLVANELTDLMRKELDQKRKELERLEKKYSEKVIPLKRGGIIRIDPNDLRNFDGDIEKFMRSIYKKFLNNKDKDDENDDDDDYFREDNTGYYI